MNEPLPTQAPINRSASHRNNGLVVTVIGCLLLCSLWVGCDINRDYEVLAFFFDGVPDPNAPIEVRERAVPRELGINYFIHKPYIEKNCTSCHQSYSLGAFSPDASLCLDCHEHVREPQPYIHSPVATGECLWCHNPHESRNIALLRKPDYELCGGCHGQKDFLTTTTEAHFQEQSRCTECHFGHGASEQYFLKPVPLEANASVSFADPQLQSFATQEPPPRLSTSAEVLP